MCDQEPAPLSSERSSSEPSLALFLARELDDDGEVVTFGCVPGRVPDDCTHCSLEYCVQSKMCDSRMGLRISVTARLGALPGLAAAGGGSVVTGAGSG